MLTWKISISQGFHGMLAYPWIPWRLIYLLVLVLQLLVLAQMTFIPLPLGGSPGSSSRSSEHMGLCSRNLTEHITSGGCLQKSPQTALTSAVVFSTLTPEDQPQMIQGKWDLHRDILQVGLGCSVTPPVEFSVSLRTETDLASQPYTNPAWMWDDEH